MACSTSEAKSPHTPVLVAVPEPRPVMNQTPWTFQQHLEWIESKVERCSDSVNLLHQRFNLLDGSVNARLERLERAATQPQAYSNPAAHPELVVQRLNDIEEDAAITTNEFLRVDRLHAATGTRLTRVEVSAASAAQRIADIDRQLARNVHADETAAATRALTLNKSLEDIRTRITFLETQAQTVQEIRELMLLEAHARGYRSRSRSRGRSQNQQN